MSLGIYDELIPAEPKKRLRNDVQQLGAQS